MFITYLASGGDSQNDLNILLDYFFTQSAESLRLSSSVKIIFVDCEPFSGAVHPATSMWWWSSILLQQQIPHSTDPSSAATPSFSAPYVLSTRGVGLFSAAWWSGENRSLLIVVCCHTIKGALRVHIWIQSSHPVAGTEFRVSTEITRSPPCLQLVVINNQSAVGAQQLSNKWSIHSN